jgi:competence protein ComEC
MPLPASILRAASGVGEALRRHPQHSLLGALAAGLAAATLPPGAVVATAVVVALALAGARQPRLGIAIGTCFVIAAACGQARVRAIDGDGERAGGVVNARATLLERARPSPVGSRAPIEVTDGPAAGSRLMARAASDSVELPAHLAPGAEMVVSGSIHDPGPTTASGFDYAAFLRRQGLGGELELSSLRVTGARRGGIAGAIDSIRARAEAALATGLSERDGALLRGMVLGQDEAIPAPVRDDFRRAGLAHLLAVSGQNVMLLGLLALPLMAAVRVGRHARIGGLLALIALYVPLAGAGPSLQRAAVMGAAGLVAMAAGRPSSRLYAVLLAAGVTLALNPLVVGDPGWQLSFAAVAGIVWVAPVVRPLFARLPGPLSEAMAVTVAATAATAPLLAAHFESVSLAALPANLLALPAVAPAMWIGMLETGIGQLAALGGPFETVSHACAQALGWVAAVPVGYLAGLARAAAGLPWAAAEVARPGTLAVGAAYLALATVVVLAGRWGRRVEPRATALAGIWRTLPRGVRIAGAVACAGALLLLGSPLLRQPPAPDRLTVRFLDVGQGDATLIQHPEAGAVLFDAGPERARVVHLLRNAGVDALRAVVVTHVSADHHGGLAEVLDRYPVELLVENGDGTTDRGFRALLAGARARSIQTVAARAGQTLRLGPLTVRILSPPPRPPGPAPEDPNPRAVIAVVSASGFDLLLSADAESPSLLPLDLPDVDAIKVPHHGSSDPGLPEVLARLRPEVAAIEVGRNTYGHPHPATLSALEDSGARVWRTDRHGTVTLTVGGEGMAVRTER